MNIHDTYTAIMRGEPVPVSSATKVYITTCDLYNDLIVMGPLFETSAKMAKLMRDDTLSYINQLRIPT